MITKARVNRQWRLAARPEGPIQSTDFQWRQEPAPNPFSGEVLVRNIYLSLDPMDRDATGASTSAFPKTSTAVDELMRGITIGVVEQSRNPGFKRGTFVQGMLGWQDYALSNGTDLTVLTKDETTPLTAYMSVFGHVGLTAYIGLVAVAQARAGETLVVSGAGGAIGSLAGQIGKILGMRVIGIASDADKCRWIVEDLGMDAAINDRAESIAENLKRLCPDGIDVYFDTAGGDALEAVLELINDRARIVVAEQFGYEDPRAVDLAELRKRRARMEGFSIRDYTDKVDMAMGQLRCWHSEGRLRYQVDVVVGLEHAVEAIQKLLAGNCKGKVIIKVSDDPSIN